jgi:hypothetical protein
VGLFAEAVRNPALFSQVRRLIDGEVAAIQARSRRRLSPHDAGAVLAFVIGSLRPASRRRSTSPSWGSPAAWVAHPGSRAQGGRVLLGVALAKPHVGHGLLAGLVRTDQQRERPRAIVTHLRGGGPGVGQILCGQCLEQGWTEHAGPLHLFLRDHRAIRDLAPALGVQGRERDEVGPAIYVAGASPNLRHPVRVEHARAGDGLRRHQQLLPQRDRFVEQDLGPVAAVARRRADQVCVERSQRVGLQPVPMLHLMRGQLLHHQRSQGPQPLERTERDGRGGRNVRVDLHQPPGVERRPLVPEGRERHRGILVDLDRRRALPVDLAGIVLRRHHSLSVVNALPRPCLPRLACTPRSRNLVQQ